MAERLALHDVDDAAAFCAAIAAGSGLVLSVHDREDLEEYLLAVAWELSERYRPGGVSFSSWAWRTLRLRVVDWQRLRFGRSKWQFADATYERPPRITVSLDDRDDRDCLVGAVRAGNGDLEVGWDPTLKGLLGTGDQQQARDLRTLGLRPRRRAAG